MIEEISSIVEREEKRETLGWDLLRDKFKGRSKTFDNEQKNKIENLLGPLTVR